MLTDRQQQIWNFLVEYVDSHGYPPTVREIGDEVGLASPSTVHAHLANLERAGLLRRDPTKPRALELIGRERAEPVADDTAVSLPLVGEIAAGSPLLADQNIEEYMTFPRSTRGDFLLRVRGESMIEAGILDGDLVIVQQAQDARNGEIVVALAGGDESADEATVKTFYRENGRIRLQPENSALEPIYADYVQILGRVVGVFQGAVSVDAHGSIPDSGVGPNPSPGPNPSAVRHPGSGIDGNVQPFARTLDQELAALLRGASLECLVCGEFVMHARAGVVFCPECGTAVGSAEALELVGSPSGQLNLGAQTG